MSFYTELMRIDATALFSVQLSSKEVIVCLASVEYDLHTLCIT